MNAAGEPTPTDPGRTLPDRERGSSGPPLLAVEGGSSLGPGVADRYEVGAVLGTGATSRVFAARDRTFDREVAMKVLAAPDGHGIARFIREARITARLEHPNIVPVHDLEFRPGGTVYFTMRKVSGISLGEALRQAAAGARPPVLNDRNALVTILLKACDAVARAHARGVVHRDLKPDNLMLGEHGEVLVVDWGEARILDEPESESPTRASTIGTPAYMAPEQARGEAADRRSDVYGLGASLFHALLGRPPVSGPVDADFWSRKRAGIIDPLTHEDHARVPAQLLAVVRKALASLPEHRYHDIAAFAADLASWQAGLAVTAYREGLRERLARWHRGNARWFWPVLTAAGLLLGAGAWMWGERLKEIADWGQPILVEDFDDGTWRERWREEAPGMWEVRDGRLVSVAPEKALLILRRRLAGSVAIEYEGEILPGSLPCDLSVFWTEADGSEPEDRPFGKPGVPGYQVQAGAYSNQFCGIWRRPGGGRVACRHRKLESGRRYRFRIEFDGDRVGMRIDGEEVVSYRDQFPQGSGVLAFYAWFPGKAFDKVRIYQKGVAEKVSALAVGDSSYQVRDFERAAALYRRVADSHAGSALGEEARFKQGLALFDQGDRGRAAAAWQLLSDPHWQAQAETVQLEPLAAPGTLDELGRRFRSLWRSAPSCRPQLRQRWAGWAMAAPGWARNEDVDSLQAMREELFPEDEATGESASFLYSRTGRLDDILSRLPWESYTVGKVLTWMGRYEEAMERYSDIPEVVSNCLIGSGRYLELASHPRASPSDRARGLILAGRFDEARTLGASTWVCDRAEGRIEALSAPGRASEDQALAALMAGLWSEVATRAVEEGWGGDIGQFAWVVAGDLAQPPRRIWDDSKFALALRQDAAGDGAALAEFAAYWAPLWQEGRTPSTWGRGRSSVGWLGPFLVIPFRLALAGDRRPLEIMRDRACGPERLRWQQKPWWCLRLLLGDIDEAVFHAGLPARPEADAWSTVIGGMRAELAGDHPAAAAHYQAFLALPLHRRLVDNQTVFSPALEVLVRQRLAAVDDQP